VAVSTVDLAVIAATLANGGVNPVTGQRAISAASTRSVLAVMASCGMYDGAGEWLYSVGLPAKSGVSGGILVVVPGQLGIAVFSPPLDASGNSVRGVRVCRDLVRDLGLHPLRGDGPRPGPIRATYRLSEVGSKRGRTAAQRAALAVVGARGLVVELQGALSFLAPDEIAVAVGAARTGPGGLDLLVPDVRRVERIDPAAVDLLGALIAALSRSGMFLIERGRASVSIEIPAQGRRRLSTLGPGMTFGEAALLDGGLRTADVGADSEVVCLALSVEAFETLLMQHPDVAAALLRNLLRSVGATAARLTREVAVLAS